jgi:very-short-patch-repair endonuclease
MIHLSPSLEGEGQGEGETVAADKVSAEVVRCLRHRSTDAERRLWRHLRDRRLGGFKFRRQVPIGTYVVDFLCHEAQLVVEVDGGQHAKATVKDARRTAYLSAKGYRVLRFWNNDVLGNTEGVLARILEEAGLSADD